MKTKKLVITALFIALSFIGANIKFASGSIAFDSMAGFLGTLILGPFYGAFIGAFGHLLTAALSGFHLTVPGHLITMCTMALTMLWFGFGYKLTVNRFGKFALVFAGIDAIIINGPIGVLLVVPVLGKGVLVYMPLLTFVAFLNVLVAVGIYRVVPESLKLWKPNR